MKVLVLGATGTIGKFVAREFAINGYEVYGQTRNAESSVLLQQEEISPVVGEPEVVVGQVGAGVDVIIDCINFIGGGKNIAIFDAVLSVAGARGPAQKLAYIFTSGTWTHGEPENPADYVSERSPLGSPSAIVQWRKEFESRILLSPTREAAGGGSNLMPIIIRPAMVYGREMSIFAGMLAQTAGDEIFWPGVPSVTRYGTIHQDDLARLYVLVAEKAPLFNGLAVDAVNPMSEGLEDILSAVVKAAGGAKTYKITPPKEGFEAALSTTAKIRPSLGYALAGWSPRKPGLVDGMPNYYKTWKAYQ